MPKNTRLNQAAKNKKDEFYTQLIDIENELRHYKEHFRGKTVLCNCDDPRVSKFFHYFATCSVIMTVNKLYGSNIMVRPTAGACQRWRR